MSKIDEGKNKKLVDEISEFVNGIDCIRETSICINGLKRHENLDAGHTLYFNLSAEKTFLLLKDLLRRLVKEEFAEDLKDEKYNAWKNKMSEFDILESFFNATIKFVNNPNSNAAQHVFNCAIKYTKMYLMEKNVNG